MIKMTESNAWPLLLLNLHLVISIASEKCASLHLRFSSHVDIDKDMKTGSQPPRVKDQYRSEVGNQPKN